MTQELLDAIVLTNKEDGRKFIFSDIVVGDNLSETDELNVSFNTSWVPLENDTEDDHDMIVKRGSEVFRNFSTNVLSMIGEQFDEADQSGC